MNLSEFMSTESIKTGSTAKTKEEILRELSKLAVNSGKTGKYTEEDIYKKFKEREELGSTGFGGKIAIPHCALDGIEDFILGILTVPDGADYDSLDGEKTHLYVFIIAPESKRKQHIRFLSAVSSVLRLEEAVKEILLEKEPLAVKESFLRYTTVEDENKEKKEYNLIHTFIQREEYFEEILNIFTELEESDVTVVEASNAGKYLYTLPLFQSLWKTEDKSYNRLIISVIEKSMANDVLRKINHIIDSLEDRTGVMVMMQNIPYISGNLEI